MPGTIETATETRNSTDPSPVWQIVSRVTAAILGGYVFTYWIGAAFAKVAVLTGLLGRVDAGLASGLVQLIAYTGIVMWVCATTSIKKTWIVLIVLTGVCVAGALIP